MAIEKKWLTEVMWYMVIEQSSKKREEYLVRMTGREVGQWCKAKNEAYGYIRGLGGDRTYSCIAVEVDY